MMGCYQAESRTDRNYAGGYITTAKWMQLRNSTLRRLLYDLYLWP
jgi:hypothetical protein